MIISSTWEKKVSHQFHILYKNGLRRIIGDDPKATGDKLDFLDEYDFDRRLALKEKGDPPIINEDFIIKIAENYMLEFPNLKPGKREKKHVKKITDSFVALYRNDSYYRELFGGIISYIVANYEKFTDVHANYLEEIENIYRWWKANDKRKRTKPWVDWGFRYIINQYRKDTRRQCEINMFYKNSVNICLVFISLNHQNWQFHKIYDPQYWFGRIKGLQVTKLYGDNF